MVENAISTRAEELKKLEGKSERDQALAAAPELPRTCELQNGRSHWRPGQPDDRAGKPERSTHEAFEQRSGNSELSFGAPCVHGR